MKILKRTGQWLLDAIFPRRCLGCRAFDTWLCDDCQNILPLLTEQQCFHCKKNPSQYGGLCHECESKPEVKSSTELDGIFIVSTYAHPLLKDVIHHFKYRYIRELAAPLGLLTARALVHTSLPSPDMIIPVPLHRRRLRDRGFNQAEEIARAIDLQIPLETKLFVRQRYTTPQVKKKSRKKRLANLSGAFAVADEEKIIDKNILLIDDVTTTGTTLEECANTLTEAGAASVSALVLARE